MVDAPPGTPDETDSRIEALERQLAEVRAEYLTASKDAMELAGKLNTAEAERDRLAADNARLREALEFYADISKYPAPFTGGMGALWSDCGQIARAALAGKE